MTFCLGMRSQFGLIAMADTRITSGSEVSFAKKIRTYRADSYGMFIMASGLRSSRDKAVTYFDGHLATADTVPPRLHVVANSLADEIRRVRTEDEIWLAKSGSSFDLHIILGGQMADDDVCRMFLIYPDGTWVEVLEDTPYVIIGESSYGKPVLDRAWRFEASLEDALTVGLLAFDATRASIDDVAPPLDVVLRRSGTSAMHEHRFSAEELAPLAMRWSEWLARAIEDTGSVAAPLFAGLTAIP